MTTQTETETVSIPLYVRVCLEIRYTGTLITPDGTDTNGYGEPCEPGYGYEIGEGWIDPSWSLFQVSDEYPETPHDTIDTGDEFDLETLLDKFNGDLEVMIRDRIGDVIGFIDHETGGRHLLRGNRTNRLQNRGNGNFGRAR